MAVFCTGVSWLLADTLTIYVATSATESVPIAIANLCFIIPFSVVFMNQRAYVSDKARLPGWMRWKVFANIAKNFFMSKGFCHNVFGQSAYRHFNDKRVCGSTGVNV